jgi:hypothetical protein
MNSSSFAGHPARWIFATFVGKSANIDPRRCLATDKYCWFIAKALGVTIHELFKP